MIKNPDSVGGKSITDYRLDALDSHLIQVENYLEMIETRLCNDFLHKISMGLGLGKKR